MAVAMYAMSVMLTALMPLEPGNPFRNPQTGTLAVHWALLLFGGVVVIYTIMGGLWAVLMTDVLQFIVLNLAILFVIPLVLIEAGGFGTFFSEAPEGFFALTAAGEGYTWFFLAGWVAIHFFMIGAEWAFVQRFICVASPRDARKSTYLFGMLYLVSPVIWLLPPLLWRVASPIPEDASEQELTRLSEQAYIHACHAVLPTGMVGLLVAAMFSATASMASSQLNVFAGVLTRDVYGFFYTLLRKCRPGARHLVWIGRSFTLVLGVVLLSLALAIPWLGGAEGVIVSITQLLIVPLLAPLLWGLFSSRLSAAAIWITAGICGSAGVLVKFGLMGDAAWFTGISIMQPVARFVVRINELINIDAVLGVALPVAVVALLHILGGHGRAIGWQRMQEYETRSEEAVHAAEPVQPSRMPALIVGWALLLCGLMMGCLSLFVNADHLLVAGFAAALILIGIAVLTGSQRL